MLIASDIDDVLLDLIPAIAEFHNREYGTDLRKKDFHSYRLGEVFGCGDEETRRRMDEFLKTEEFKDIKPVDGAVEGVIRLRDNGHSFVAITSRVLSCRRITEENVERYFPGTFTGQIYFATNHYLKRFSDPKSKGAYVMIEDSVVYAEECRDLGIEVLLMDSPANRNEEAKSIFKKNKKLSNRYVELARKIAMKVQLKMPKKYKRQFCKHCYSYLKPGVNSRVRINKNHVVIYCLECKKYTRIPLGKRK